MTEEAELQEAKAFAATARVLAAADKVAGQAALAELPIEAGDVMLVGMALGNDRRDMRAMMLGKAAYSMAQFGDAASGIGVTRALEAFWVDEGQADDRYRPLARVEVGSVLTTQAQGLARLGEVARVVALVEAHTGLHDKRRHLSIIAAEVLARARRMDEAWAMLPAERPVGDSAEETGWDVVRGLLEDYEPDEGGSSGGASLNDRWNVVTDKLQNAIGQMGTLMGVPAAVNEMMKARLEQERANMPQSEAEFVRRVNALMEALGPPKGWEPAANAPETASRL